MKLQVFLPIAAAFALSTALLHGQSETPPAEAKPDAPSSSGTAEKSATMLKREKHFSRLDKDNDGFLSHDEFMKGKFAQKKPERAEKRFSRCDRNADKKLSKDEWLASPERRKKGARKTTKA